MPSPVPFFAAGISSVSFYISDLIKYCQFRGFIDGITMPCDDAKFVKYTAFGSLEFVFNSSASTA